MRRVKLMFGLSTTMRTQYALRIPQMGFGDLVGNLHFQVHREFSLMSTSHQSNTNMHSSRAAASEVP